MAILELSCVAGLSRNKTISRLITVENSFQDDYELKDTKNTPQNNNTDPFQDKFEFEETNNQKIIN